MFKSILSPVEAPEIGLHDALFPQIESFGDSVALVDGTTGREYTFTQVLKFSRNAASGLVKLGLKKGDVLAVYCPNILEYPLTLFATWACGGVVTTINPAYTAYELAFYLKDSGASYLLTMRDLMPNVRQVCQEYDGLKKVITIEPTAADCVTFTELMNDDGSRYPDNVKINGKEDLAMLLYSSGTTGLPKGVMLTHYNFLINSAQLGHEDSRMLSKEEGRSLVVLGILPFFHTAGLCAHILSCLGGGTKLVCLQKFEPRSFLRTIEKYKVNKLSLVPRLVLFLNKSPLVAEYDVSSVKFGASGAAPLEYEQQEKMETTFGIGRLIIAYGLTEATAGVTTHLNKRPTKRGSVGLLAPNMDGKIVDPATGKLLGPGERGELCIRGPNITKGYLNRPQATQEAIDRDGFFHTGDIAYIDEDGYLFVVDRLKELIKYKGFQVAPAELEGVLLGHPDVIDAGVTGVPDQQAGEVPRAYVVKRPGSTVTGVELQAFVEKRVAPFKRLRGGLIFVNSVPRNPAGKLLRSKLAELESMKNNL